MANVGNHLIFKDVDNNVWEPGVYGWTEVEERLEAIESALLELMGVDVDG